MHKMIQGIKKIASKTGIDGAIAYTVLSRVVQALGGVVSILFISKYLTKVEQGYYYTFGSILALQIFFELGLSGIITQFVAHEKAYLQWEDKTKLVGDRKALSRLASLLRFCVKWFFVMAIVLLIVLLIIGYLFFSKYGEVNSGVEWKTPWIFLSVSTACNLVLSPVLAFFEGLGKVKEIAKIRLLQQLVSMIFLFSFFTLGMKLFSSPISALIGFLTVFIWLFFSYKKNIFLNIWYQLGEWDINYRSEVFPYQWKIALSWMSGYLIFQLFNPVLFATEGATVAGQMGMTLAALSGVLSISISWINTKVPLFSGLVAKKEYVYLDLIFDRTVKQASLVCILCLVLLIVLVYCLQHYNPSFGNRFLPVRLIILLSFATFVNQLVSALATYLRCHKKEPYLIMSIVSGILTAGSTIILGRYFGVNGIVAGYSFVIVFVSLVWAYSIFKNKKKEWHDE